METTAHRTLTKLMIIVVNCAKEVKDLSGKTAIITVFQPEKEIIHLPPLTVSWLLV